MHFLFALPGLHRVERGAEVVIESVAGQIARNGKHRVTVVGSGPTLSGRPYQFIQVGCMDRTRFERWPKLPFLRTEFMYEDLTFALGLKKVDFSDVDVTITCSFPYSSLALRMGGGRKVRPSHVFVTQNGDWPAHIKKKEARLFRCDGLICTNPIYFNRNRERWPSVLIPNGVDPTRYRPGSSDRALFGLPADRPVILMVSALEPGKRVLEAMEAVAGVEQAHLHVAGDGPLRDAVDRAASRLLPGRFTRGTYARDQMPHLYRSADLFLHTKIEESFGNVYIEAASIGLPIVAHDDQVTRWILGDAATLVDTRSTSALTLALRDSLRGARMSPTSIAARAHDRFGWQRIARDYEAFLEQVSNRGRELQYQGKQ